MPTHEIPSETKSFECPHTERRRFRYAVGGKIVVACNACDPEEVIVFALANPPGIPLAEPDPVVTEVETTIEDPIEAFEEPPIENEKVTEVPVAKSETLYEVCSVRIKTAETVLMERIYEVERARNALRDQMKRANAAGLTWSEIARITGKKSPQAAQGYATHTGKVH